MDVRDFQEILNLVDRKLFKQFKINDALVIYIHRATPVVALDLFEGYYYDNSGGNYTP